MTEQTKKVFGTSISGYNRAEVDRHVAWLQKNLAEIEQYNSMAMREQNALRERIVELEESAKLNRSPGYAQVGAQFEQTLRLAESEAAKLVNDAAKESVKLRETAKAEVERMKFEVEDEVEKAISAAKRQAKSVVSGANKESRETLDAAEDEMQRVESERARLSKEANVIRSDADNYVSKVKAELQSEVERIQNENSRVLKRNAEIESEISEKIDVGEKQSLEIFRKVQSEAEQMRDEAERELAAATQEASSLVENAEEALDNARREADRMASESQGMALALISDARARVEAISMRSLDIAREAIAEAEYRLSKLPQQANAIEAFLEETARLITPEQEVIIARRKSLNESLSKPLEADLVQDAESVDAEEKKN
jgi:cell division septum initiation protein DivIVA